MIIYLWIPTNMSSVVHLYAGLHTFPYPTVKQNSPRKPHSTGQIQSILLSIIAFGEFESPEWAEPVKKVQHQRHHVDRKSHENPKGVLERVQKRGQTWIFDLLQSKERKGLINLITLHFILVGFLFLEINFVSYYQWNFKFSTKPTGTSIYLITFFLTFCIAIIKSSYIFASSVFVYSISRNRNSTKLSCYMYVAVIFCHLVKNDQNLFFFFFFLKT